MTSTIKTAIVSNVPKMDDAELPGAGFAKIG